MKSVGDNIEHIKEIVAMQQSYAKVSGLFENLAVCDLVEDALRLNIGAFERHQIDLVREFEPNLPTVRDSAQVPADFHQLAAVQNMRFRTFPTMKDTWRFVGMSGPTP